MAPQITSSFNLKETKKCTEDIVISGMSGQFPASSNVDEFEANLFNKVYMPNDDETRFQHTNPMIPRLCGKIKELRHFDGEFFGIPKAEGNSIDPQGRMLLEEATKAVLDAGINPKSLFGTNTGVFIGNSIVETEEMIYSNQRDFLFGIAGCRKGLLANRISYCLGLTGPSLCSDTACSSSIYALDVALKALKNGDVDAAIVGGANLCLHVNATLQFSLLGVLSASGICRSFDAEANGYCRSEAIGCLFLQRKSAAKRIYATLVASKANCDGFKLEGITYPSGAIQEKLLKEIYAQEKIDFEDMGYIEAHSTATLVGDPEECKAIDNAIARHRKTPLKVGSVKSNCGHSEPAAGVCSIVKVLIAMNSGLIPPNINLKSVKSTIESLRSGRLVVVTSPTKLEKPYVGINSFGFGGANAHAILKQFHKVKSLTKLYEKEGNELPRLVLWSARTEPGVDLFLQDLEKRPLDFEYVALAHSSQEGGIKGFNSKGYCLLLPRDENTPPTVIDKKIMTPKKINRKVVLLFTGVGGHWQSMGRSLMQLPQFEKSIQKCHSVLEPLGLSLRQIVSSTDRKMLKNIVQSFVGITAIQLALIDLLKYLGVEPDFFVGQSIGEVACAYADGCLTAEEAMLVSYYCGKIAMEKVKAAGAVALVRARYEEIADSRPKSVDLAGVFSQVACMVSGPKADVSSFCDTLKGGNIYTEELTDVHIGFHGKQMTAVVDDLTNNLKKIIARPKLRSKKWISTSTSTSDWLNKNKSYASAEYFANNLQSSVLFDQALQFIPKDVLAIDVGPTVFKRSVVEKRKTFGEYIQIMSADSKGELPSFLSALGSLYLNGLQISIDKLYPKVEFPVSRGTRCMSPLIGLDHSSTYLTYHCEKNVDATGQKTFTVSYNQHQWLMGHEIDGRVLLPATFYLECVWRTLSGIGGRVLFESLAVEFENIKFERATTFTPGGSIELNVVIHFGSGQFEITESNSLVVSGFIRPIKPGTPRPIVPQGTSESVTTVCKRDFYKELKLRGYHYNGDFQCVENSLSDGSQGQIKWIQNWTTFMDCMLQMSIIGQDSRTLMLPTRIRRLRVYPGHHLSTFTNNALVDVYMNKVQKRLVAGGIEILDLNASAVNRRRVPADPVLEKYQFLQHFPAPKLPLNDICRSCIQIFLENQPKSNLQIVELAADESADLEFLKLLGEAVGDLPLITGNYTVVYDKPKDTTAEETAKDGINQLYADEDQSSLTPNIVVVQNAQITSALESAVMAKLENKEFIIIRERASVTLDKFVAPKGFTVVAYFPYDRETYVLLRKVAENVQETAVEVLNLTDSMSNFGWIETLQKLCKQDKQIILVAQGDKLNGIIGLTNCLRKEPDTKDVRCVFIDDPKCPPFDVKLPLFANQLKRTLGINVYREGTWGTYRHLKIREEHPVAPYEGHAYGHMSQIGDMHSLQWYQGPLSDETADVKIVYSSLNFRDVMQASGRLPIATFGKGRLNQACIFGFEYSGIDPKTGKRIMGMTTKGAVGSHLRDTVKMQFDVPEKWSMQEAASVPVVYVTIYYAFFFVGDIRKGKSILIHAGSGGVGLAAIGVAQAYGLEVYTTVSTKEKREYLLKRFPKLKESNIGNSRDNSFEQMIMEQTGGQGVDFVLNSLSEDKLKTSLRCLSKNGHFLEIGKYDMAADNPIELGSFLNGITFSSILADQLLDADKSFVMAIKQHVVDDINKGIIKPLPVTVYEAHEIETAFRYLMSGKHIGKVVLQVRKDEIAKVTLPISVTPQVYFKPNEVYIIPGGLGGFGLELADWMIVRGARKIVLSSSRGITNDYQKLRIILWKSYGCEIVVNTADISSMDGCLELLTVSMKLGPVGGIFNLAVMLRDAVFQNQTVQQFQESFKPKAYATIHLDQLSRQLCPNLSHFVIFSSVSCGRGNAGQTNYGMANSIMERIIENRVNNGLPGKAVQWGAVGEVGLVAEMAAGKIDLEIGGTLQQRISSCLQVLDVLLSTAAPIVSSMVVAEKKASAAGQTPLEFVLNTLSIRDIKTISMTAKLSELGLDSLTSVEIRQTFERDYGITLNTADLRALTMEKLAEISESVGTGAVISTTTEEVPEHVDFTEHLRQFYGQIPELLDVKNTLEPINDAKKGDPIIVIPGIDGCGGKVWAEIGKRLNSPTYVIQYQETSEATKINEVVDFCTQHIVKFLKKIGSKSFRIIGYSMGAFIAHQVVSALETLGFQGKVLYIDGSPEFVQNLVMTLQKIYRGIEMEKMATSVMLSLVLPQLDLPTILRDLRLKVYKEEISIYLNDQLIAHNYPRTNDMISKVAGVLSRLQMIQSPDTYANIGTIDAELLLVKPSDVPVFDLDEHYGLGLITRSGMKMEVIEGNHQTILNNDKLPGLINDFFAE